MEKLNKWDIAAALVGTLAWLSPGKIPGTANEGTDPKQKILSIFGAFFGKVDEGMWATLLSKLSPTQKRAITLLLKHLRRYREVNSFRYTLINAPAATTTTIIDEDVPDPADKTKTKKIKRVVKVGEYSDQDARVVFLRQIADLVDDPKWGLEAVRDMLRTHQLATENKVAKWALAYWDKSLVWAEKEMCEFFDVKSLDKITNKVNLVAKKVPKRSDADLNPGWWSWMFKNHPVYATLLIIGIIAAIAICYFPPID